MMEFCPSAESLAAKTKPFLAPVDLVLAAHGAMVAGDTVLGNLSGSNVFMTLKKKS